MKSKAEKTGMSGFEFAKGGSGGMHKFTPSKTQEAGQTGPAGSDTGKFAKGGSGHMAPFTGSRTQRPA